MLKIEFFYWIQKICIMYLEGQVIVNSKYIDERKRDAEQKAMLKSHRKI
jgi:hypothetical protein